MMPFKRSSQRYGQTPVPETPFQRAGQLWDERIGAARVQAKNWRLMAFGCLALACALGGGVLWQARQTRIVPYVVEVDAHGAPKVVAPAVAQYRPTDAQVSWHLARFVANVRSVSLDPVLTRASWLEAYAFATRRGALFLDAHARAADPFARLGERTVSVQVTSVVRASERSFQVKWVETAYEQGALADRSRWTAILTVVARPPASAEVLRRNPLGLYVDAIDWSRELEAVPPRTGGAPSQPSFAATEPLPLEIRP